jgi:hypothetical protein
MTLNVPEEPNDPNPTASALRGFLAWAVGLGTCLVILMATMAFGPSGFGFAVVIALCVFGLMAKRYRFSLRAFLILTTLFGIWLGLKVS